MTHSSHQEYCIIFMPVYMCVTASGHVRAGRVEKRPPEEVRRHGGPVEHWRHVLPRGYGQPAVPTFRRTSKEQGSYVRPLHVLTAQSAETVLFTLAVTS